MIFPNLADEISERMVREYAAQNRALTIAGYERNYRELMGDVMSADVVRTYWPQRYREGDGAYNERVKVWTQVPRIICQRLTNVALGEEVERKWLPIADSDQGEADRANELQEYSDTVNDWDCKVKTVGFYALGIGEVANWPEFRRFDKQTGEAYAVAGGQGVPVWEYQFPWFVEPISLQDYQSEVIGAARLLWMDNQLATPLLSQLITNGAKQRVVTEVYLAPQYDRLTGKSVHKGFWRKWENAYEVTADNEQGQPDERWKSENLYGCSPVVFYRGPDADETQFRGKSYSDRFRDLAIQHSRQISDICDAIECLPNIWVYTGEQKSIDKIVIRRNSIISVPVIGESGSGKLEQAARALDLSEDWKAVDRIEKLISLVGSIPQDAWTDALGKAGAVESGVALRLTLQPLAEGVYAIRESFARSEREQMRVTVKMFNAHNPGREIDLAKLRASVKYVTPVIPRDEAVELLADMTLMEKGLRSRVDMVKKHNPHITTDEQAQAFLDANTVQPVATGRAAFFGNGLKANAQQVPR